MPAQQTRQQLLNTQNWHVLRCQSGRKTTAAPFIPLNLKTLMMGERLTFTLYLKVRKTGIEDFKFLPYINEGEILEPAWMVPLEKMGIRQLYIAEAEMDRVLAYLNNHLLVLEVKGPEQIKEKLEVLSEHLALTLARAFSAPRLGSHIQLAHRQVDRLVSILQQNRAPLKVVWEILSRDYTLYSHSVNVCLLGTAMMLFLKKTPRESMLLGMAGLFHDLGMTRLPEEILNKPAELTEEEWDQTKRHPATGAQMLKSAPSMPQEALRLVKEHHENADGSGYPVGLPLRHQHPLTRIIRVLDAYDAITSPRVYRPAQTPYVALRTLQEQQGPHGPVFDAVAMKSLIHFLALS